MADEDPGQATDPQKDSRDFANMRKRAEAAEARVLEHEATIGLYRASAITNAARLAGFKPDDKGSFDGSPVVLLVEKYEASLDAGDLPAAESFTTFAGKFGLKPDAAGTPDPATETSNPLLNPVVQQLDQSQTAGDLLRSAGGTPTPSELEDRIKAAEAAGDVATSIALKNELFFPAPA